MLFGRLRLNFGEIGTGLINLISLDLKIPGFLFLSSRTNPLDPMVKT